MNIDEGMGHGDGAPGRARRRVGLLPVAGLVAAVAVVAVLVAWPGKAAPLTPASEAPALSSPSPAVTVESGRDSHKEAKAAPAAVWAAFEVFMGGWVSKDPAVRQAVFAAAATPALAAGLALTSPENVITGDRARVEVVGAGPYSAEFRAWFDGRERPVDVLLVADPGSPHGWRVTAVEPT